MQNIRSCFLAEGGKILSRRILNKQSHYGGNFVVRLVPYKNKLHERLQDPDYAVLYLEEALGLEDQGAFLVALKHLVEASGGMKALSDHVEVTRPSLYKALSREGNPTLRTLREILRPLGLKLSISKTRAA